MQQSLEIIGAVGVVVVALAVAMVVAAAGWQAVASARTARDRTAPGTMVDVDGHRLHFHNVGTGEPTVVLEAGGGSFSLGWGLVQDEAARTARTRVVSYDRAGLGWSDPDPAPYSIQAEVDALHAGLTEAGIAGRLILVGHSYGGFLVRMYAALSFPGRRAGSRRLEYRELL